MSETRQLKVVIAGDAKSARAAIKTLSSGLDEAEHKTKKTGGAWESFSGKLAGIGALAAGGLAVAGAGIATLGIKTAANFQQLEVSFGTLLKSNDKAKSEMAWLKEKAAATPFELSDLANADRTLLGFGFKVDETRKNFLMSMGEIAAAVGLPSSALPDLSRVFGQVHAAGVVGMEDINQLIDNGVPIWDMLTAATGKSVAELRKEIEARKLSADTFEKATETYTKNNFAGSMDAQSKTLTGLWSSLKDNASMAAADMVKPLVPLIEEWLPKLGDALKKASDFFTNTLIPAISDAYNWYKKNEDVINALAIAIGVAVVAWKAYTFVTVTIPAALKALRIGIIAVNAAMRANPIGVIITLLLALGAGLVYLFKHNKTFHDAVIKTWNAIKGAVMAVVNWFKTAVPAAWGWVKDTSVAVFNGIKDFFAKWGLTILAVITGPIGWIVGLVIKYWDQIKAFTLAAWNAIVSAVMTVINFVVNFVKLYFKNLFAFWSAIWNGIVSAAKAAWKWIKDLVSAGITFVRNYISGVIAGIKIVWSTAWAWISNKVSAIWSGIKSLVSSGINFVRNYISWVVNGIKTTWTKVWDSVSGFVSGAWNKIKKTVSGGINGMMDFVKGIPGRAKDALGNLGSTLYNSGKALIQGFIDGIKKMVGKVKDVAGNVLDKVKDFFPNSPAKTGPFSGKGWTLYSGQAVMRDWAEGIDNRGPAVRKAVSRVMGETQSVMSDGNSGTLAAVSLGSVQPAGGLSVTVNVSGTVTSERDLVKAIALGVRDEIARNARRNGGRTGL